MRPQKKRDQERDEDEERREREKRDREAAERKQQEDHEKWLNWIKTEAERHAKMCREQGIHPHGNGLQAGPQGLVGQNHRVDKSWG